MTDDITKTARELLDALPDWEQWRPSLFYVVDWVTGSKLIDADPENTTPAHEARLRTCAIAALPRTVAALVEEVERLRAAAAEGLTKVDAFVASEHERALAEIERLREVVNCDCDNEMRKRADAMEFENATARHQALRLREEIERLRAENAALTRDAALGRAVREIVGARDGRIADPIAYLEDAAHTHTLGGEILLAVARALREEVSDG